MPAPDPIPIPPHAGPTVPNIIAGIGIFMMLLGFGYQKAAADHPEVVSQMGNAVDWGQIAGVLVTVGGLVSHTVQSTSNKKNTEAAVTHAAYAPPVDRISGEQGAIVTAATAVQQAMIEGNHPLAGALQKAVEDHQ